MPTLLYDYLRTQKSQVDQQQLATQALLASQKKWLGACGGVSESLMLLSTTLLWVTEQNHWLTAISGLATLVSITMTARQQSKTEDIAGISIWQLLIVLVIIVLLFGTKRLRSMGSDLGSVVKGFKKSVSDDDVKNHKIKKVDSKNDTDKDA